MALKNLSHHEALSCGSRQAYTGVLLSFRNFPLPDFSLVEISILVHPKQISVVSKSDKWKNNNNKSKASAHSYTKTMEIIAFVIILMA